MPLRVTYLSVAHNLLFSFISFPFIHAVAYSSPFTGKRYNVDYRANWNYQPPPTFKPITLTIPHPASVLSMFKPLNFNANWDYNFGSNYNHQHAHVSQPTTAYIPPPPPPTTTKAPYYPQQVHSFNKQFNVNWNFNHGSSLGAATSSHEKEEAPVSTTVLATTPTTTQKPVSDSVSSNGFHGEKRINLELSLNVNQGASASSSTSAGNNAPSIKLQPPNKATSTLDSDVDDDLDDGFGDDESKNDADNESTR